MTHYQQYIKEYRRWGWPRGRGKYDGRGQALGESIGAGDETIRGGTEDAVEGVEGLGGERKT